MAIPKECKMPDLSELATIRLTARLIGHLLIGERRLNRQAGLYLRNFIRLLDKAIREYSEAREVILCEIEESNRPTEEMVRDGQYIFPFIFTDHIETCINAIARVFRLLERIKSEKDFPAFPRELRKLVETKSTSIKKVRDTVEHMDEKIQTGEISPGIPAMLILSNDTNAVVVSKYRIGFSDLAMILRKMHEIALYILTDRKIETEH